jgi:hypothetical protein
MGGEEIRVIFIKGHVTGDEQPVARHYIVHRSGQLLADFGLPQQLGLAPYVVFLGEHQTIAHANLPTTRSPATTQVFRVVHQLFLPFLGCEVRDRGQRRPRQGSTLLLVLRAVAAHVASLDQQDPLGDIA